LQTNTLKPVLLVYTRFTSIILVSTRFTPFLTNYFLHQTYLSSKETLEKHQNRSLTFSKICNHLIDCYLQQFTAVYYALLRFATTYCGLHVLRRFTKITLNALSTFMIKELQAYYKSKKYS
jgi:hypothetical protein